MGLGNGVNAIVIILVGIFLALGVAVLITRTDGPLMRWNDKHHDRPIVALAWIGAAVVLGIFAFNVMYRGG